MPRVKSKIITEVGSQSFHRVATHGAIWNVGLAIANKGITLSGQVVLAWLLTPADMGLAGMAMAMSGFAAFLSAASLGDVLIQRKRYKAEAGQGLWLSFVLSSITALLIALMAPIMKLVGRMELSGLLIVLAFSTLAVAPNTILAGGLKNKLDFKHLAISNFIEGASFTCFSVLFAFIGLGPYALILPIIPRAFAGAGYVVMREGWLPLERPNFSRIKKLLKPTISLAMTGFFIGLLNQAPIFFAGLVLNPTSTGIFAWGWSVAGQAVFLLAINLRQVLMPIFTKLGEDKGRQIAAVLKSARVMTAILTVFCGLQALLAPPLLDYFFPPKWHQAGPVITCISLGLVFQGIWISISSWLNAGGRYKELIWISAIPTILASILAFLGAHLNGVEGAALGTSVGMSAGFLFAFCLIPVKNIVLGFKKSLIPFLISVCAWVFIYYAFFDYSLALKVIGTILFLFISGSSWLYLDDGELKNLFLRVKSI